ncbi:MAG: lipoprotein [Parvibaculum sp.]|jgi:predicted small lipoprotein YifL
MTTHHLPIALLGIFLIAAMAGCGKKGPLELPPGATPAPAAETNVVIDEEPPIDLRPMRDGMGATRATRGNDD